MSPIAYFPDTLQVTCGLAEGFLFSHRGFLFSHRGEVQYNAVWCCAVPSIVSVVQIA